MLFFQLKKGNEEVGDCFVTTEMIYFGIKSRIVQVDVVDITAMPEFTRLSFAERRKKLDDVLCKGVFYTHRRASTYNKGKSSLSILSTNLYALPPPLFLRFLSRITFFPSKLSRETTTRPSSYESNELNMNDKFGTELPARTRLILTPFLFKRCTKRWTWIFGRWNDSREIRIRSELNMIDRHELGQASLRKAALASRRIARTLWSLRSNRLSLRYQPLELVDSRYGQEIYSPRIATVWRGGVKCTRKITSSFWYQMRLKDDGSD